jgi:hypothetical protein
MLAFANKNMGYSEKLLGNLFQTPNGQSGAKIVPTSDD